MKTRHLIGMMCAALVAWAAAAIPAVAVEKAGDVVSVRGKAVIERKAGKVAPAWPRKKVNTDTPNSTKTSNDKRRIRNVFKPVACQEKV